MKILFLITKSDVGGAQKYVRDLSASLPKNEFQTHTAYGGVDIRHLSNSFRPYFLFLNDIAAVVEIALLLRKMQPDILHLNSSKAGVIGAIAAKLYNFFHHKESPSAIRNPRIRITSAHPHKVKVVFTAHGWVFNPHTYSGAKRSKLSIIGVGVNPENRYSWLRQRCYILFHKFAALFQDAIINVSEYDRQLALRYTVAPAQKLFTIHNGIDVTKIKFLDKSSAREALLAKLSPPLVASGYSLVAKHWIGSIGRLVAEKDYATLIDTAALLKRQMTNDEWRMAIVGDGYERPMLEKKIATLGLQNDVFLLGALPNAEQYLKAFDVFVMSSVKEGLPYTLLEAMAAGLPIVATRTGGMPEVLQPNNGISVPPRDSASLADAIKNLLADNQLQKTLSANAENYAKRELTLDRMVQQTIAVYERLQHLSF